MRKSMWMITLSVFFYATAIYCNVNDKVLNLCQPGLFAMTFDQGPSIYTGDVLDALDAQKCKATFHPVVSFLQEPSIVANLQRAYATGHLVGFSLEPGANMASIKNPEDMLALLATHAAAVQRVTGSPQPPIFVRLPELANLSDDQISTIVTQGGYIISTYNLDSYDYADNGTEIVASFKSVLDLLSPNTKGGFISVQRDYIKESVQVVPDLLQYIQNKGYSLVTLDKCFPGGAIPGHPTAPNITKNNNSSSIKSSSYSIKKGSGIVLSLFLFILTGFALF